MKILRKNDEFKKMPDSSVQEILVIKHLLNQGWNYCPKQVYKEFFKVEVKEPKAKEVKDETEDKSKPKREIKKITKKRFEHR